jgi:hypothetical protein
MRHQSTTVEAVLADLAGRSHGVVTRAQLLAAGIRPEQLRRRMRSGALIRVHPGVYRVGHLARSVEATFLAAVWSCGNDAALSGRAAAYLWGIVKGRPPAPEVTAPGKHQIQGVTTHRARNIERTTHRGIPVATVPRTLVDLAEREFLARLAEADLPRPITNRRAHGRRVDCRWPEHRLTVELDSYHYHRSRHAWEQDRRREREARARGDEFRRYTYGDVVESPRLMLAELRPLLR